MNFTAEFSQVCFQCSADFIQPSFHLFCDAVVSWSVSINRALLSLLFDFTLRIYMPVLFTLFDAHGCMIYVHELTIQLLKSKFESCFPVLADPSTVEQWRVPSPLAKRVAELTFPLVVQTPKSLEFSSRLFPRFVLRRAKPIVTNQSSFSALMF